jgi:hypothetical protein
LFPTPTPTPSLSTEAPTAALSLAFTSRISGESPTLRSKSSTDISRPVCRSFTVDAEPRAGLTPAPGEFVGACVRVGVEHSIRRCFVDEKLLAGVQIFDAKHLLDLEWLRGGGPSVGG